MISEGGVDRRPDGGDDTSWHASPTSEVVARLHADVTAGLSTPEVRLRLLRVGSNSLPEPSPRSRYRVIIAQLASPLVYLLLVAAGIALVLGHRSDAAVIAVVIGINTVIGALQEGRAERSLRALRSLARRTARVIRDGEHVIVTARDVVPGDVLVLEAGDAIAADARLLEAVGLRVAEAALTGESRPTTKHVAPVAEDTLVADRTNMVYAGTFVTAGSGRAIVVATGTAAQIGRIARLAEAAGASTTPLQDRVAQFGRVLLLVAMALFVAIVAVGLARGAGFVDILLIGISQIVGVIPEGLPVAMTIALAVGVRRIARRHAIVRQLVAVETLGCTTVICTDKTGTLTRNEMTATRIGLPDGRDLAVTGAGYGREGTIGQPGAHELDARLRALLEAGVLCNNAEVTSADPVGDPTEIALLVLAIKGRVDVMSVREANPRSFEIPFDPTTKVMATAHRGPRGAFTVIKGAPEVVLALCDGESSRELQSATERMGERALRVLAVAIADGTLDDGLDALRGRFDALGVIGQSDAPREGIADAIARCRDAGIRTVMITGDHALTGMAIARDLGIGRPGDEVLDGRALDALSDDDLARRIDQVCVFARVQPAQKLRIVAAFQRRGDVVAMTGDGVNDAPALVKADVGVAMGHSGTEVAKQAAKIVLVDDDFTTIVSAVEEGRVVYRNIKKAILMLFSTSIAEVTVLLAAILLGFPPPFAAVQILWNNLVTEGLITVNLVLDAPEGDEMKHPPIERREPLLDRTLRSRMVTMVPTIVIATLGWFILRTSSGVPAALVQTETFTLLAICEWFNVLNCRSATRSALDRSVLHNPWLIAGLVLANALQVAAVFWPPLSELLHTVPFDVRIVVMLGIVGSSVLWVEEIRKWIARRRLRSERCDILARA